MSTSPNRSPRASFGLGTVLFFLLAACSGGGGSVAGPAPAGDPPLVSGVLTAQGSHTNLLVETDGEDPFTGGSRLHDVTVRLVDPADRVVDEALTGAEGEFELRGAPGPYRLLVVIEEGRPFTIQIALTPETDLTVWAKLVNDGPGAVLNAEIFPDNDHDGQSDTGTTTQIVGRVAGQPDSGQQQAGGNPTGEDPTGVPAGGTGTSEPDAGNAGNGGNGDNCGNGNEGSQGTCGGSDSSGSGSSGSGSSGSSSGSGSSGSGGARLLPLPPLPGPLPLPEVPPLP